MNDGEIVCIHKGQTSTKGNIRNAFPPFKLNQHCSGNTISHGRSQLFLLIGSIAIYRQATLKILLKVLLIAECQGILQLLREIRAFFEQVTEL